MNENLYDRFENKPFSEAIYELSKEEKQILDILISGMAQDAGSDNLCYIFKISDYAKRFRFQNTEFLYRWFSDVCDTLQCKGFTFEDDEGVLDCNFIQAIKYDDKEQSIEVMVSSSFKKAVIAGDTTKTHVLLMPRRGSKEDFNVDISEFVNKVII